MQFRTQYLFLLSSLLAPLAFASLSLSDICSYSMDSTAAMDAIICLRSDQPTDGFPKELSVTASLGATNVKLCCPKSSTCLLSNATDPAVMCYDAAKQYASSRLNTVKCTLQGDKCNGNYISASTDGVLTITRIVDGKGFTGSSSGSSSGSKSSSAPGSTATKAGAAAVGGSPGYSMLAFMVVVGGVMALR